MSMLVLAKSYSRRAFFIVGAVLVFLVAGIPQTGYTATITPRVEIAGDPGTTLAAIVKLYNEERESKTFYTVIEGFNSQDETGNPHFLPKTDGLPTWISLPGQITIGPGEFKEVEFRVAIPKNAEPGGHFAAIFFQTDPPDPNRGGQVSIASKLGSLILLRVSGEFEQGANILEFGTQKKQRFFTELPVHFYYRFQNTGDDHLKPVGDVVIENSFGRVTKVLPANPVDGSVLPKSIRRFETVWASSFGGLQQPVDVVLPVPPTGGFWKHVEYQLKHFAVGKYTAELSVVFGTKELQSDSAEFTFFVLPWQSLVVIGITLLLLFIILKFTLRRYNRFIISGAQRRNGDSSNKRKN